MTDTTSTPTLRHTVSEAPDELVLGTWDAMVSSSPGSDVAQLSAWAAVRRDSGYRPLYVLIWRRDQLVAGAQVLTRRLPLVGEIGYVPYGPIVRPHIDRTRPVAQLASALDELAGRQLSALFIQPTDGGGDVSEQLLGRGFRPSTAEVAPPATVRIDLSAGEDELRAALSKRVRRWTGKWDVSGVRVRRGGRNDLPLLTELIASSAGHHGYPRAPADYLHTLHAQLEAGQHVEIFVAEVDGRPVAAELFTACGGVLRARLTGLDRESPAHRLSVVAAIDWKAINWAKTNGFSEFDLGGLNNQTIAALAHPAGSARLAGPALFKLGFGGTVHHYPLAVEKITSPISRAGYRMLRSGSSGRAVLNVLRSWMRYGGKR